MQNSNENPIVKMTFEFALKIIAYTELLEQARKWVMANQLLKSGTSVGANVREAQNAESKADFVHKFKIAAKEADETEYWLLLCNHSASCPDCTNLLSEIKDIQRVINKIISTTKRKVN